MTLPLPCGHRPLPTEHLRRGDDHWCPVCLRYYAPGDPPPKRCPNWRDHLPGTACPECPDQ